jgi:hypothetical protein
MKTFASMSKELNEAKFKAPRDQKEVKRDIEKVGGKKIEIVFTQDKKGKIHVYLNGDDFTGGNPYKDMKQAEKETKDMKKIMLQMSYDGINTGDILDEINIRI